MTCEKLNHFIVQGSGCGGREELECIWQNSACRILSQVVAVAHPGNSDSIFPVFENVVWAFGTKIK